MDWQNPTGMWPRGSIWQNPNQLATSNLIEEEYQRHLVAEIKGAVQPNWNVAKKGDKEECWLSIMLQNATYTQISNEYCSYCESRGIEPPPTRYPFKIRMAGYDQMDQEEKPWVKRFKWLITRPYVGMIQCARDKYMFRLHDIDGSLVLWAVTFLDDVVYGGSEKRILEDAAARYLPLHGLTKVGELDMLLGL